MAWIDLNKVANMSEQIVSGQEAQLMNLPTSHPQIEQPFSILSPKERIQGNKLNGHIGMTNRKLDKTKKKRSAEHEVEEAASSDLRT